MFDILNAAEGSQISSLQAGLTNFLPLIVIFALFYLFIIRPQQQKQKKHKELLNNLKIGDKVVTSSGFVATVNKVDSDLVSIVLSENNIVEIYKTHIVSVIK